MVKGKRLITRVFFNYLCTQSIKLISGIKEKIVYKWKQLLLMMKNLRIHNWHIFFYICIGIVVAIYLYFYLETFDKSKWNSYIENVHVELAGAFFDIVIFGIIFYAFQIFFQKKEKIIQLSEQLDDFRDWDEKEAGYRVIGILKRLHKLGVENVNLSRCHFNGINIISDHGRIFGFDFKSADLTDVTFSNIKLSFPNFDYVYGNTVNNFADYCNSPRTIFTECDLINPSFSNNIFHSFNFIETNLKNAQFVDSQFNHAQFRECIFDNVIFKNVIFTESFFQEMDFFRASYTNVEFIQCTFENCECPDSLDLKECKFITKQ